MQEEEEEDEVCAICQEKLENAPRGSDQEPVASKCDPSLGHVFHRGCYTEWLSGKQAINKTCPICRQDPLAPVRIERARKATLARLERRRKLESGRIGKARVLFNEFSLSAKEYLKDNVAPNLRMILLVTFVVLLAASLLILAGSRYARDVFEEKMPQQQQQEILARINKLRTQPNN